MTQAELARTARVMTSYVWKLESGGAAPGIDLVARLAATLATTVHDLVPATQPADSEAMLRDRARGLFDALMSAADRETLLMLTPLLAQLGEAARKSR